VRRKCRHYRQMIHANYFVMKSNFVYMWASTLLNICCSVC
jgi:hypothetical protein